VSAIAHYNLLERISENALGELYRARDTKVGRTVALRLVKPAAFSESGGRGDFFDNARAVMRLSHPNIATLFDAGEHGADCYLAYEFASGITLRQENSGRAVNPRRAVELAVQIADALADAHGSGVVHGDLRPDTIMVTNKGSARILEFGIARWTCGGRTRLAAARKPEALGPEASSIVGYMSPEQVLGGQVDGRTDIFSLGVVLYEMLTGRNPFLARTPADTVVSVMSAAIAPAQALSTTLADLDALVTRAMAKDIEKRPQSAAAFSAELRGIGAILDVRSGDSSQSELLPLDDEGGGARWWMAAAACVVIAALIWWMLR
jgi:serine/threonine protein kinase